MIRLVFILSLALAVVGGCAGGDPPSRRCTSSRECGAERMCIDGRCVDATDAGPQDAGPQDAGPAPFDAPPPDAPPADSEAPVGLGCSSDLRDVLGADGAVLYTCPSDQGCREGRCVPACEGARASRGTIGCEFFVTSPPSYPHALPPCLAMFVANAWPAPARLSVRRGATSYDATAFGRIVDNARPPEEWAPLPASGLPAGQVAVLFLSSHPDAVMPENGVDLSCPITPAVDAPTVVPGSGIGEAFRVTSNVPVRAYDILPFGGARSHFPSAQLLIPSNAWGTDYVVIATPPGTHSPPGPLWLHVMALENGTRVRVQPSIELPRAGAIAPIGRGEIGSFALEAGQYVQWEVGTADPSGTVLVADRPIAVVAGNRFLRLQPRPAPGGESTHQQILPTAALASEYVAAPYETRRADLVPEEVPYRIVGVVNGTRLTFDPPIAGAPATLSRGEVVDVTSDRAFVVRSQDAMHPFALAQLMTTANLPGGSRPGATAPIFAPMLGDEEFVIVFPPSQYLDHYVFFTDPTYATTNLTVVRARGSDGRFAAVTIDCLGEIGGWRTVGDGRYETTTVDLMRANVPVGACTNGRHVAESNAPFGIVVWGLDTYASYAYPAGGNARQLADLPPLL